MSDDLRVLVLLAVALSTATVLTFTVKATTVVFPVARTVATNVATGGNMTLNLRVSVLRHYVHLHDSCCNWRLLYHNHLLHLVRHHRLSLICHLHGLSLCYHHLRG